MDRIKKIKKLVLVYWDEDEKVRHEIDLNPAEPDPANPNRRGKPSASFTERQVRVGVAAGELRGSVIALSSTALVSFRFTHFFAYWIINDTVLLQIEEIYVNAYDQPKVADSAYSDDNSEQPYRYLKYWYLYNSKEPNKRLSLPSNTLVFSKHTVLAGWLQPPPPDTATSLNQKLEPVFVVFDNVDKFSVDRTPEYRGYWVYTKQDEEDHALYWLQEPCDVKPPFPDNKSQADVHFDARVVLAAVSLLCDRVFNTKNAIDNVKESVEEVVRKTPLLQTKLRPPDVMFDYEMRLLAKYKAAIAMHLIEQDIRLTAESKFMKTLAKLRPAKRRLKDALEWTEGAEKQSLQYSWGGPNPNRDPGDLVLLPVSSDRKVVRAMLRCVPLSGVKGDTASAETLLKEADEQVQAALQRYGNVEDYSSTDAGDQDSDSSSYAAENSKKKRKSPSEPARPADATKRRRQEVPGGKRKMTGGALKSSNAAASASTKEQKRRRAEQLCTDEKSLPKSHPAKKANKPVAKVVSSYDEDIYSPEKMSKCMVRKIVTS
jgi:hypothetical protein